MKKILMSFILILSIFISISNVNAANITINFDYDSDYVKDLLTEKEESLKIVHQLNDYFKQNNIYYITLINFEYIEVIYFKNTPSDFQVQIHSNSYSNSSYITVTSNSNYEYGFYFFENDIHDLEYYKNNLNYSFNGSPNINIFSKQNYLFKGNENLYNDFYTSFDYNNYTNIYYETNINSILINTYNNIMPKFNNTDTINYGDKFKTYVEVMNRFDSSNNQTNNASNLYSINTLANLINGFITDLYSKGISFYVILISLFIFNVILYIIRAIVCDM